MRLHIHAAWPAGWPPAVLAAENHTSGADWFKAQVVGMPGSSGAAWNAW